jgi:uncharacterized OsmC-like protein
MGLVVPTARPPAATDAVHIETTSRQSMRACRYIKRKKLSQMGSGTVPQVNGISVAGWKAFRDEVRKDASLAERQPTVIATWVGGSRSRVELGGKTMHIGGKEDFNAMQTLLGALAACDVDLLTLHAALLGLEVTDLRVEATGHFNVRAYLGLEAPGSGYTGISYKIILNAPGASDEQIRSLRERIERSSPVGDSLGRSIPLTIEFNTN